MSNLTLYNVAIVSKNDFFAHKGFVEVFYPRIPESRMQNEDDSTPRVCMSQDITGCIQALPKLGTFTKDVDGNYILEGKYHAEEYERFFKAHILAVHEFHIDENDLNLVPNEELVQSNKVPDADNSGEQWYLSEITPNKQYYVLIENLEDLIYGYAFFNWKNLIVLDRDYDNTCIKI